MRTKLKLVFLELSSGLFGWIWIGASIAAIYFLYKVMATDAPWTGLLWSLVVALITKQIAAVLALHQRRLDYLDRLAEYGYTRTRAEEAWRLAAGGGTNLLFNLQQAEIGEEIDRPEVAADETDPDESG